MKHSMSTSVRIYCRILHLLTTTATTTFTTTIPTPVQIRKQSCENALSEIKIDLGEVESRLDKLREDKSVGADELSPRLLKQIQEEIRMPILHIWKKSLDEGIIPCDWKFANISPIQKKGSRSSAANYRPVSLDQACTQAAKIESQSCESI